MNSNTKLDATQKSMLKDIKKEAKQNGIKWVNNGETTIAYKYMGNTVRFAMAVRSPDETKFRRKVGEYLAITRLMWDDKYTIMRTPDFIYMLETDMGIDIDDSL